MIPPNFADDCIIHFSEVYHCTTKSRGRIRIPREFIERLDLKHEIIVVGCGNMMAIMKRETWENRNLNSDKLFREMLLDDLMR